MTMMIMVTTMMIMMMMKMMIKMIITVSQLILKVGPPDFALQQIQIIPTDDFGDYGQNDDDDNDDDENCISFNLAIFKARSFNDNNDNDYDYSCNLAN